MRELGSRCVVVRLGGDATEILRGSAGESAKRSAVRAVL